MMLEELLKKWSILEEVEKQEFINYLSSLIEN